MSAIKETKARPSEAQHGRWEKYLGLRHRISTRFLIWFIAVSLPPLFALSYITLVKTTSIVEGDVVNNLAAIADYEVEQIQKSVALEEQHIALLSRTPIIIDGMEQLAELYAKHGVESSESGVVSAKLQKYLTKYQEEIGCYDVFLISLDADVVFSMTHEDDFNTNLSTGPYRATGLASVFQHAKTLVETQFSDLAYYEPSSKPAAFIATPVFKDGILIGVIAIQVDVDKISSLVRNYSAAETSSESILALKADDEIVFLTPLRHDTASALERKVKLGSIYALPMQRAVAGDRGAGISVDYSGTEVLAAWRYLPHLGWGLVVKIDSDEAFASIAYLKKWYFGLGCATLIFILMLSAYAARSISGPIIALTKATNVRDFNELTEGVEVTTRDELGILAVSFNKMIRNLKTSGERMQVEISERKLAEKALMAGEQQLKASNQQLQASEQQLKASNQQLQAGEQQLKASNLQLQASEQQLKASNQQLRAGEQQLKASYQQLKQSQQKLALHVQQTPMGVIEWNLDFEVTEWNSAAEKMFGFTREEAMGRHAAGLIVPESAKEIVDKVWRDLLAQKGGDQSTYENTTKDNRTILCDWYNTPLVDNNGEVVGVASLINDITERKRAEQNTRDLAHILENSLNEIYIFDAETFKFILVNYGARENIGYELRELTELTPLEINPEFTRESFVELVEPLKSGAREIITFDTVHERKDGSRYDVKINLQLSEFNGKPAFVAIILDITEIKRLQQLESRAERLETAGTIAGQVAHDFNNLLAPIMAYPEFIHDELPHDHKAHAYLDAIENAAKKIADINQDLLTMGRRGHYNQEVLDLNRVVMQAEQEMESRSKTVVVKTNLCQDLMKIKGGAAQIHRMISNLLVNALDAMHDIGQVTITTENYYADDTSVVFGLVPKGEYVKLTVSDTGCGIPEDIRQKILDPFFSTKATDKKRGSGLGLSVVDAVMKDHNGYLDLNSKVGQGTSFYLYFPITREGVGEDAEGQLAGGSETVLVVDDDVIQREVSSHLLTKLGYKVSTVESGEKAVAILRENPQNLVILDMVMPGGIDGAETYRRILEHSPHQKAIILSGFSESDRVLEAQRLGAGAFIRKPVTKSAIAGAVRTELDRKATQNQDISG